MILSFDSSPTLRIVHDVIQDKWFLGHGIGWFLYIYLIFMTALSLFEASIVKFRLLGHFSPSQPIASQLWVMVRLTYWRDRVDVIMTYKLGHDKIYDSYARLILVQLFIDIQFCSCPTTNDMSFGSSSINDNDIEFQFMSNTESLFMVCYVCGLSYV